ncbi:MAG: hypothetical protein PHE24_01910 [Patescibacteria group bacterium]|nr:hypothetical protein [Patescibacteria group bacterium]
MNSQKIKSIRSGRRYRSALIFSSGPPERKNHRPALDVYAKVAEEIAAQEGNKNVLSEQAQRFLRILQKNLLGGLRT